MGFSSKPINVDQPKLDNLLNDFNFNLANSGKVNSVEVESVDMDAKVNQTVAPVEPMNSVEIPPEVQQTGYTVSGYGEDGAVFPSMDSVAFAEGSSQATVHEMWVNEGASYKNDIATMNVNGKDRYLIVTSDTFGNVGDMVTLELSNGEKVDCVIADTKGSDGVNLSKFGNVFGDQVNVVQFEVNIGKFNASGNPTTESWGLEWDSNSPVVKVENYGSIINK